RAGANGPAVLARRGRHDIDRDADGLSCDELRQVGVVRRRADRDGISRFRHDALPAAAASAVMVSKLFIAWALMAVCVIIHAAGVSEALNRMPRRLEFSRFWRCTWLFICVAGWMILLHLLEITVWAVLYLWTRAMSDLPTALYFSAVTY